MKYVYALFTLFAHSELADLSQRIHADSLQMIEFTLVPIFIFISHMNWPIWQNEKFLTFSTLPA